MRALYLVSVWLHIVAAMAWVGGMLFLVAVLVPLLRTPAMRPQATALFHAVGTRFRPVGWIALTTLVITGVFNVTMRGYSVGQLLNGEAFAGRWGAALALKLAFVTLILAMSAVHDFWLGPRATRLSGENAPPEVREKWRRVASWMGRITFLLSLAVIALAVTLVR
jgi:copper resistance protein D